MSPSDRCLIADRALTAEAAFWPTWWTRDDQLQAAVEGWCIGVFSDEQRITTGLTTRSDDFNYGNLKTDDAAVAWVTFHAAEGSDLHQRALALHVAHVLTHGQPR